MNKKFISSFILSFLSFLLLVVIFVSYVNPKQIIPFFPSNNFTQYHQNMFLRKAKLMEASPSFNLLLLGSSTSEAYLPVDINKIFDANSFSASIGGANSFDRSPFFQHALTHFKQLKHIIYIVDFFEFNQHSSVDEVKLNPYLGKYLKNQSFFSTTAQRLKYLLSHNSFEASISVIKKSKKPSLKFLNPDGTTTRSMITAPLLKIKTSYLKENSLQFEKLEKEIQDNLYFYRNFLLNSFNSLSKGALDSFKHLNKISKEKNIKITYVLSPYHLNFKTKLLSSAKLKNRYNEWKRLFSRFSKEDNITVYDPSSHEIATNPLSIYWRDGLHYNREGAYQILKQAQLVE